MDTKTNDGTTPLSSSPPNDSQDTDLSFVWPGIQKVCDTGKTSFWVILVFGGFVSLTVWKASSQIQVVHHGEREEVWMKFKRISLARLRSLLERRLGTPPSVEPFCSTKEP